MKKNVSLKDIAQAAGVSTALVSYVLNNKEKEARVGEKIAKDIREIAKKLNYQPNHIAKSLKSGKSFTIGLIVADISNPFFANLARTVEDEAKKHNYTVIFASSDENPDKSRDLINVLMARQVDGFIIVPTENSEEQIKRLADQHVPFVLVDRYFPSIQSNFVITDNYHASYDAVNHLVHTGHKKIGLVIYRSGLIHMQERRRGYLDALKDNKLSLDESLIKEIDYIHLKEDIDGKIIELIKQGTDAIFFATNTLALGGLRYLSQQHYRIPEDLALACFDAGEAFDFFYSPITFVEQPLVEAGQKAVHLLVDEITQKKQSHTGLMLEAKLIVKKSSGA